MSELSAAPLKRTNYQPKSSPIMPAKPHAKPNAGMKAQVKPNDRTRAQIKPKKMEKAQVKPKEMKKAHIKIEKPNVNIDTPNAAQKDQVKPKEMKKAHGKSAKPNVNIEKPKVVINNLKVVPKSKSKAKSEVKSKAKSKAKSKGYYKALLYVNTIKAHTAAQDYAWSRLSRPWLETDPWAHPHWPDREPKAPISESNSNSPGATPSPEGDWTSDEVVGEPTSPSNPPSNCGDGQAISQPARLPASQSSGLLTSHPASQPADQPTSPPTRQPTSHSTNQPASSGQDACSTCGMPPVD
jgi:hypothetical protein